MNTRILTPEQLALIDADDSTQIIVLSDSEGHTRVVQHPALQLTQDGRLLLLERQNQLLEDRKLIRGLTLQQPLTLGFGGRNGRFLQVTARPVERHSVGRLFQALHERIHAESGEADLISVWVLEVLEAEYEDFFAGGLSQQRAIEPLVRHG